MAIDALSDMTVPRVEPDVFTDGSFVFVTAGQANPGPGLNGWQITERAAIQFASGLPPRAPDFRLYDCSSGLPSKSGDTINIVFTNTNSLQETLDHFDEHTTWTFGPGILPTDFCLKSGQKQGAHQASHLSFPAPVERWHVRFYHDSQIRQTFAAAHYDECAPQIGLLCNRPHKGTKFAVAREEVRTFFEAQHDASVEGGVLTLVLGSE